jgi:murein DD-endopeptidase MepM/ murein hydrolase activator NlpD
MAGGSHEAMKKHKFKFNQRTLQYERHKTKWTTRLLWGFAWLSTAVVFGIAFHTVMNSLFPSSREAKLQREIDKLQDEYVSVQKALELLNDEADYLAKVDDNIYRQIMEAEPISQAVREAGYGGRDYYARYAGYDNSELMISIDSTIERIKRKLYIQSLSYDELKSLIARKSEMLASIPAIQPISNKDLTRAASGFGYRIHPIYKTVKFHEGLDFTAPQGTEIYATGDGTVIRADAKYHGYGNMVAIDHGYGYETRYAHMSRFIVREGQKVKRGELIGYVGSTGLSTSPHCHYEVLKDGQKVNPVNYFYSDLTAEEYARLVEIANQPNQSFD